MENLSWAVSIWFNDEISYDERPIGLKQGCDCISNEFESSLPMRGGTGLAPNKATVDGGAQVEQTKSS